MQNTLSARAVPERSTVRRVADDQVVPALDVLHAQLCDTQLEMFRLIARMDRLELWRGFGTRDMAAWLCIRFGIADWRARRWIGAAHALEDLPAIASALSSGRLGVDKVVELARFARPETRNG
jgi:hypothetical protein